MSELSNLSRRRFVRLAILTTGSLVIGTNQVHAAGGPCPNAGQACTFCQRHNAHPSGGRAIPPGRYPDINPWREWRNLNYVTPV